MPLADHGDGSRPPTEAELRSVVEQHAPTVYRVALSVVRDHGLADDVVQETLVKAWRQGPLDDDGRIPTGWMIRVARNTAISVLRSRREVLCRPDALPNRSDWIDTPRTVEGRAQLEELWEAMRYLDEDARTLLVLREVDELGYEEIAASLELPLPTVKTRLFRARKQLKDALKEWR